MPTKWFAFLTNIFFTEYTSTLLTSKIIGGEDVEPRTNTYVVYIQRKDRHICAGALISDRHVLTAAGCVRQLRPPSFRGTTVVVGSFYLQEGGMNHHISYIMIHHNNDRSEEIPYNDIAVIGVSDFTKNSQNIMNRERMSIT